MKNSYTVSLEILVDADSVSEAETIARDLVDPWTHPTSVRMFRKLKATLWTRGDSTRETIGP